MQEIDWPSIEQLERMSSSELLEFLQTAPIPDREEDRCIVEKIMARLRGVS